MIWIDLYKGYCLFYCHAAWVVTARLQTTPPGNTKRLPIHSLANARQSMLSEHQVFCMCCLTGPVVILKHNHELHIGKIMKNKWVVNRHQLDSFHPFSTQSIAGCASIEPQEYLPDINSITISLITDPQSFKNGSEMTAFWGTCSGRLALPSQEAHHSRPSQIKVSLNMSQCWDIVD